MPIIFSLCIIFVLFHFLLGEKTKLESCLFVCVCLCLSCVSSKCSANYNKVSLEVILHERS